MYTTEEIDSGMLNFGVESRIIKELGERLVRTPEVALVELIKNAYDADATVCTVKCNSNSIEITDNGTGMTLDSFKNGWMRVGTSIKNYDKSKEFGRSITGEKGIGRFSVRFLGNKLRIRTIAEDKIAKTKTRLDIKFDWAMFDGAENLNTLKIPYKIKTVSPDTPTGTSLTISSVRREALNIDFRKVKSWSIGLVNPLQSLFKRASAIHGMPVENYQDKDPGFLLDIVNEKIDEQTDVAATVLNAYALRAVVRITGNNLDIDIFTRNSQDPFFNIIDEYENELGSLYADIRYFPNRKGTFSDLAIEGGKARSFVRKNCGVSVFDRNFRVQPYGNDTDDWLLLQNDRAKRRIKPRSTIAEKYFPMSKAETDAKSVNWMRRLPTSNQLIGIIQIDVGHEHRSSPRTEQGLIAVTDREGFVENNAFDQLRNVIRGSIEAIAFVDRKLQQEELQLQQEAMLATLKDDTDSAILEITESPDISEGDKSRIIDALNNAKKLVKYGEDFQHTREQQLEIMSLLGVVAGYLTHEFGIALREIEDVKMLILETIDEIPELNARADKFDEILEKLKEILKYTSGYIHGTKNLPKKKYPVKPRIDHVAETFGKYASDRNVAIEQSLDPELQAPLVPAALYDGILLNLFTNALKAVTAKLGNFEGRIIFRAWNDKNNHYLEVADNGIGIPSSLKKRVFDPLFTTTESQYDPLGSGMGLGLSLVKRGVEAFGGNVKFVKPHKKELVTSVLVSLPLELKKK